MNAKEVMLGNEAIARGIVEAGCHVVTSYPGTPSSEILPEVVRLKKEHNLNIHTEWSVNEKVAFDVALGASYAGKRAAVVMKQVGLNVAADSLMSSAYTGVIGGFVVISCDDPGPHSSQTEQDTRFFAMFAKVPVLDPSDPAEAKELVKAAFELSERHEIPVILRPAIRVCHAKQTISLGKINTIARAAEFKKDPGRWAATPKFRLQLHEQLNRKLERVRKEFESADYTDCGRSREGENQEDSRGARPARGPRGGSAKNRKAALGILAAGVPWAHVSDILADNRLADTVPLMKMTTPFPLPLRLVNDFIERCRTVLVLEEPEEVIELQLVDKRRLLGRFNGFVPRAGELTPEVVYSILQKAMRTAGLKKRLPRVDGTVDRLVEKMKLPGRRPTLCPGCPHRASFFAIRKAFSVQTGAEREGATDRGKEVAAHAPIFTSDIGCYTLGLNLGGVDTCLDMGAGITLANGFYRAFELDGKRPPLVATIGDSTFFHAGVPALINAVYNKAGFVLVILDNGITAMTGMQPTPDLGIMADGTQGNRVAIEHVVKGCGVEFLRICDPYNVDQMISLLKEAHAYAMGTSSRAVPPVQAPGAQTGGQPQGADGRVAVVIARRPCVVRKRDSVERKPVRIDPDLCKGCKVCLKSFECPALVFVSEKKKVELDKRLCIGCGVCVHACKYGAIVIGS
ncbi:MAG: thiamine pyrophosphate-dependent enzyme [Planctomycetota bacterium]|nr:thiamine pyrophosphate-dependent enzyme [Planctomycetota bacterium]